jgi:anti-anti-sigma regulatory factor
MALFSKPPAKKPDPSKDHRQAADRPRPVSAREVAAQVGARSGRPAIEPGADITVTGESLLEWSAAPSAIEVAHANPGLCSVLENAALLYASAQSNQARALLEQGVQNDPDAKTSPLAWLALFDLLQRAGDRAAFDQYALQYVVQFERSSPAWEETLARPASAAKADSGGYIAVSGKLSANAAQLEGLRRAIEKNVPRARLDLATLTDFDDAGARRLAETLALARKQRMNLTIQRPEKLREALEARVRKGREGGEGAWLLALELLQWEHNQASFDDRALEFAIAFELSPPSWEPPPLTTAPGVAAGPSTADAAAEAEGEALVWSGLVLGSGNPAFARVTEFATRRAVVVIDMTAVERIDFVGAGALLNAINRVEMQRRTVQIIGASPIIRALLLLIGISPRHFVKKTQ